MTTFVTGPVSVTVPATSANLGPGYDALGLALSLRDRVSARIVEGPEKIVVSGEGAGIVSLDRSHLVHRSMRLALEHMGVETPSLHLECENRIPHGRGLGSSSAAIVGGVCLARGLVAGGSLLMDDETVFALAAEIEGHPDNVAPAFYGGFTVAWSEAGRFRATVASVDPRVTAVALVPPDAVETEVARGLLPDSVSHADAAANVGRAALLVAALGRQPELLFSATEDRLHQDYREPAMPRSLALVRELRAAGLAALVSGAGPTVLVLTDSETSSSIASQAPEGWRALELRVENEGAVLDR